jgi:hypothetical protein
MSQNHCRKDFDRLRKHLIEQASNRFRWRGIVTLGIPAQKGQAERPSELREYPNLAMLRFYALTTTRSGTLLPGIDYPDDDPCILKLKEKHPGAPWDLTSGQ